MILSELDLHIALGLILNHHWQKEKLINQVKQLLELLKNTRPGFREDLLSDRCVSERNMLSEYFGKVPCAFHVQIRDCFSKPICASISVQMSAFEDTQADIYDEVWLERALPILHSRPFPLWLPLEASHYRPYPACQISCQRQARNFFEENTE